MKRFLLAGAVALGIATSTLTYASDDVPELLARVDDGAVRSLTLDEKASKRGEYFKDTNGGRYRNYNSSERWSLSRQNYDEIRKFCDSDPYGVSACSYRGITRRGNSYYHVVRYNYRAPVVIGAATQGPCALKSCVAFRSR